MRLRPPIGTRWLITGLLGVLALLFARVAYADPEPATIVVLGATGDLSSRLLTPALTEIIGSLPKGSRVVGVARGAPFSGDAEFRVWLKERTKNLTGKLDDKGWTALESRLHYQPVDLGVSKDYLGLKERLATLDRDDERAGEINGPRRVIFYYAFAPTLIGPTTKELAKIGLIGPGTRNDVVPEKPIGIDGKSAAAIISDVISAAGTDHVYFMDHYNGKPGVQSLQQLRTDPRFARMWDKRHIDHLEVTALESIGVEGRGSFYDPVGATRDMVQSHLLQTLSFATMRPKSLAPNDVAAAKAEALESLTIDPRDLVRGQYRAGAKLGGYLGEIGVEPDSATESYVKLRLRSSLRKLSGVAMTIESGKALSAKQSQVVVHMKRLPTELALDVGLDPKAAADLRVDVATGTVTLAGRPVTLAGELQRRSAYATQLMRVVSGDKTFFPSAREIRAQWKLIDPIEQRWQCEHKSLARYQAGSKGPASAKRLAYKR